MAYGFEGFSSSLNHSLFGFAHVPEVAPHYSSPIAQIAFYSEVWHHDGDYYQVPAVAFLLPLKSVSAMSYSLHGVNLPFRIEKSVEDSGKGFYKYVLTYRVGQFNFKSLNRIVEGSFFIDSTPKLYYDAFAFIWCLVFVQPFFNPSLDSTDDHSGGGCGVLSGFSQHFLVVRGD